MPIRIPLFVNLLWELTFDQIPLGMHIIFKSCAAEMAINLRLDCLVNRVSSGSCTSTNFFARAIFSIKDKSFKPHYFCYLITTWPIICEKKVNQMWLLPWCTCTTVHTLLYCLIIEGQKTLGKIGRYLEGLQNHFENDLF